MIVEQAGARPTVDPGATIYPGAVLAGDVTIGRGSVVLSGAIVTAQGAPVHVGAECVVMENAVVRGAGSHPCTIGDHVLIGPQTHVSGATIEDDCFVATGAALFNGAVLGHGSTVAVHAVVHVAARCAPDTFVPIGHVAFGDPARVYRPDQIDEVHAGLFALGFTRLVFDFDSSHLPNAEATRRLCRRYARALARHAGGVVPGGATPGGDAA